MAGGKEAETVRRGSWWRCGAQARGIRRLRLRAALRTAPPTPTRSVAHGRGAEDAETGTIPRSVRGELARGPWNPSEPELPAAASAPGGGVGSPKPVISLPGYSSDTWLSSTKVGGREARRFSFQRRLSRTGDGLFLSLLELAPSFTVCTGWRYWLCPEPHTTLKNN